MNRGNRVLRSGGHEEQKPISERAHAEESDREAALLARVAAGDRHEAFVVLYRRYEGRLYGLGLNLLGDASLAEELVQETFVRLWRSADRYDPDRGAVSTFVWTIARGLAIDIWRRQNPATRNIDDHDPSDADHAERIVRQVTVRDALQSLSPKHREALELTYQHGYTQSQVAERLGVPLGTVKSRCFHALRALEHALSERGGDA